MKSKTVRMPRIVSSWEKDTTHKGDRTKQQRDWRKVRIGTLPVERKRWSANVVARGREKKKERPKRVC